ncbi:hypothetical protein PT974_04859 [Cladobotryum mycophilum]|uniref:Thioredoxin domain-containing protein n=1 Tax=Cladobotryum mycophilum TaxID=491253 RepID=A0ABR0SRN4_9HYPO
MPYKPAVIANKSQLQAALQSTAYLVLFIHTDPHTYLATFKDMANYFALPDRYAFATLDFGRSLEETQVAIEVLPGVQELPALVVFRDGSQVEVLAENVHPGTLGEIIDKYQDKARDEARVRRQG